LKGGEIMGKEESKVVKDNKGSYIRSIKRKYRCSIYIRK
jgi:hypothetical protein